MGHCSLGGLCTHARVAYGLSADTEITQMNWGGAKDRPDLHQVWENANAKLHDKEATYTQFANQKELDELATKLSS